MSEDDRVGARPLSAFHTNEIVSEQEEKEEGETTIGITPLKNTIITSDDDEEDGVDAQHDTANLSSILMDDHAFFLRDPHADPPIESPNETMPLEAAECSEEEYHSPLEEEEEEDRKVSAGNKSAITSSPYDYDVNWDMVGHLRRDDDDGEEEEKEDALNTTSCSSLAEAAAASTLVASSSSAAAAAAAAPQDKKPLFRTARQSYGYRSNPGGEEDVHEDTTVAAAEDSSEQQEPVLGDFMANAAGETSVNESSTSSSSGSVTHRRRRLQSHYHRRPYPRAASAPLPTSSIRTRRRRAAPAEDERTSSSLDSGMAAVRRWIRSRGGAAGGSSRAARSWQREHDTNTSSTLQLGEEDIFALTNAGEDPRSRLHNEDDYFGQYPPSILEEEEGFPRQRALSEPDGMRMRNFFFQRAAGRRASADGGAAAAGMSNSASVPTHLSSAALNSSLFHSPQRVEEVAVVAEEEGGDAAADVSSLAETTTTEEPPEDPGREARMRWIRINRRFQLIITVVALLFSLLLFAILVCWIVLTSAYVISIDKPCDVPLKSYFWLATLQLILDVFRTDIMRFICRWDARSNDRIPGRVIAYNIAYLIYALLVLRLGVRSVFMDESTCPSTAKELFHSSKVFVSLSIAAWSTIVLGYIVPFCFVATLLTWNGYNPAADTNRQQATLGGVFPTAFSSTGAPPGCIDELRTVLLEEFPDDYPAECCICMADFVSGEAIVVTECQHVFHKRCCQEWLRQARTCPVCRTDIPSSLANSSEGGGEQDDEQPPPSNRLARPFPGREDIQNDVVGLIQILRQERMRQRNPSTDDSVEAGSDGTPTRNDTLRSETEMVALEEGRIGGQQPAN